MLQYIKHNIINVATFLYMYCNNNYHYTNLTFVRE